MSIEMKSLFRSMSKELHDSLNVSVQSAIYKATAPDSPMVQNLYDLLNSLIQDTVKRTISEEVKQFRESLTEITERIDSIEAAQEL